MAIARLLVAATFGAATLDAQKSVDKNPSGGEGAAPRTLTVARGAAADSGKNAVRQTSSTVGGSAGGGGARVLPSELGADGRYLTRRSFTAADFPRLTTGQCTSYVDEAGSFVYDGTALTGGCTRAATGRLPAAVRVEADGVVAVGNSYRLDLAVRADGDRLALTCMISTGTCTLQRNTSGGSFAPIAPADSVPGLRGSVRLPLKVQAYLSGRRIDVVVNGYWLFGAVAERELDGAVEFGVNGATRTETSSLTVGSLRGDPLTLAHYDFAAGGVAVGDETTICRQLWRDGGLVLSAREGSGQRCAATLPAVGRRPSGARFAVLAEIVPEYAATYPYAVDYADWSTGTMSVVVGSTGYVTLSRFEQGAARWTTVASGSASARVVIGEPLRLRIQQDGDLVIVRQGGRTLLSTSASVPAESWPAIKVNDGTRVRVTALRSEQLR